MTRGRQQLVYRYDASRIVLQEYEWNPTTGWGSFVFGRDDKTPVPEDQNRDYGVQQHRYWLSPDQRFEPARTPGTSGDGPPSRRATGSTARER